MSSEFPGSLVVEYSVLSTAVARVTVVAQELPCAMGTAKIIIIK